MVVLEGPDGGGKSTLAEFICNALQYDHMRSEGPEQYHGEINDRILRYERDYHHRKNVIFDRHPCVSQVAYGLVHSQRPPMPQLVSRFYDRKPLLIYCRPDPAKVTHTASNAWDTPEYMKSIDEKFEKLMDWYDRWAVWNAQHIYRIGDSYAPIIELIKGWRKV